MWDESMAKRKAAGADKAFVLDSYGIVVENTAYWEFSAELFEEIRLNSIRERESLKNETT